MRRAITHLMVVCVLAVLASTAFPAALRADPPDEPKVKKPAPKKPMVKETAPKKPMVKESAPKEKPISMEFRNKQWSLVLEWLSDLVGLPVVGSGPTGTFTFISPRIGEERVAKMYTVPEVIDIINEALLGQNYVLIRRESTMTVMPADEKIPPHILRQVPVTDLDKYGKTEVVIVTTPPLESLVAEDIAHDVKKMMGPFGEVIPFASTNQMRLQDAAGNLRIVWEAIGKREAAAKVGAQTWSHRCKYVLARDVETRLRELLGEVKQIIETAPSPMGGQQPQQPRPFTFGRPMTPPTPTTKVRVHHIASDERTNTLFVSGPADKLAQAKVVVLALDVPPYPNAPPIEVGEPVLKHYSVTNGTADTVVKMLSEIYKGSTAVRIQVTNPSQIMVWGTPQDQLDVVRNIPPLNTGQSQAEQIPLTTLEAPKIAETLKNIFGDSKSGGPYVEADLTRNVLLVKGTPTQLKEIKYIINAFGEGGQLNGGGGVRIISLEKGSAATLAEAIGQLLPQLRANPVRVILPGGGEEMEKPRIKTPKAMPREDGYEQEEPQLRGGQLSDPRFGQKKPSAGGKLPGDAAAQVTITAFGNKLIISSDDPAAANLVQELVRLLTQTQAGEGDFQLLRLRHANAADAAKIIDQAFNGTKSGGGKGGGLNLGGGMADMMARMVMPGLAGGGGEAQAERVRVVADPATNSILVKATPLDLLTVRRILDKIDSAETDSEAVIRTWVIGPLKNTSATEVAQVISDVYRQHTQESPTNSQAGGMRGFAFFGQQGGGQQQSSHKVSLSVGVNERSNELVVATTTALYEDIKTLVERLEKSAGDSTRVVRLVPIKGIDPALVQQAIDAIQGRSTNTSMTSARSQSNNSNFSGGFNQRNANQGGFQGGGFQGGGFQGGMMPGMFQGGMLPGMFQGGGFPMRGTGGGTQGGGRPGGPGGGGGLRGGGGRSDAGPQGQPPFFVQAVKDDHSGSLFDPRHEELVIPISFQEGQPALPTQPLPAGDSIRAPLGPVRVEPLHDLGVAVVSGNSKADVDLVLQIIEYMQKLGSPASTQIMLHRLQYADATSTVNILTQLYQRVVVNAQSTAIIAGTRTATPALQGQGAQALQQSPLFNLVNAATSVQPNASVVLLPIPRQNAILLAAPKARIDDILREIHRLDTPNSQQAHAMPFPLKKAAASRVASLLTSFYAQRYTPESAAQNQVRITFDDSTNTVFVQASPADLEEIRDLILRIDTTVSSAISELRIVPLRNAVADELRALLLQAISEVAPPTSLGTMQGITTPGQPGGLGQLGQLGQLGGLGQQRTGAQGTLTKGSLLKFISTGKEGPRGLQAGEIEDVRINADARTNRLLIAAPEKSMQLILALVRDLDVPPTARAEIHIFSLKKADAVTISTLLQQLFVGSGATGAARPAGAGIPGLPTTPGALTGAAGGVRPLQLSVAGFTPEGAPLIDLRLSVDERTNSIIAAGSRNDLDVIEAIISRLEDSDVQSRRNEIYRLKNAIAADVAAALNDFLTKSLTVYRTAQQLTTFQELQRDIVIVPEPISNTLLVSATPRYFEDILRFIIHLDSLPPQVLIQALIAEVDLTDTDEFGVELGLQTPVFFQRSVLPSGTTLNSSVDAASPGFNFNSTNPLGQSTLSQPGVVGLQGINNLGLGRASSISGVGGFVFSAASDSFNLLIRALRTQNRIDVLSRPQIMTADNQAARILVGQNFPYITGSNVTTGVTGIPTVTNTVNYKDIGVQMQVTPKINPDGTVVLRVVPEISSLAPTTVNLGNGVFATAFNVQTVETTVVAQDGETVAIGGLITRREQRTENRIPWFGDLPGVGALFRYRQQQKRKSELIVILTPHIVRCKEDAARLSMEEAKRMSWVVGDAAKLHGAENIDRLLAQPYPPQLLVMPGTPVVPVQPQFAPVMPAQPQFAPAMPAQPPAEAPPAPRPLPSAPNGAQTMLLLPAPAPAPRVSTAPSGLLPQPGETAPAQAPALQQVQYVMPVAASQQQVGPVVAPAQAQAKETQGWRLFRKLW